MKHGPGMFGWIGGLWKRLPRRARTVVTRFANHKFLASVVAVIVNDRQEVLILDHVLRPGSGWGLPGGFMEPLEEPEAALRRELFEEVGLELADVRLVRVRNLGSHIEVIFRASAAGEPAVKSSEIRSARWFSADALPQGLQRAQKDLISAILNDDV